MGSDITLSIIPASEIEVRVSGTKNVREITTALRKFVQSVSRSDRFAAELMEHKTDFDFLARKLHDFLNASYTVDRQVWNEEKKEYEMQRVEIQDRRTQLRAWENAVKVFGLEFMLPKTDVTVNVNTLAIARDVQNMTPDELIREARGAMERMKDIDPSVFTEAEVVDDNV